MTKFVRILRPCKTKLEKVIINLQSQLSSLFLEWSWMQEKSENAEIRFENNLWTSAGRKLASQAHSAWPSRLVLQCRVCVCYSHRRRAVHQTLLRWQPIRVTAWSWLSVLGASGTADPTEGLLSSDWLPTLTAGTWFYHLYKSAKKFKAGLRYNPHPFNCTSLQTDNHTSTPPLKFFLQAGCPSCCPTNSVKALKAYGLRYNVCV